MKHTIAGAAAAGLAAIALATSPIAAAGTAFNQEVSNLAASRGWSPGQASAFVGAATAAFCPQLT